MSKVDESKFPYGYVPDHLKERVKNCQNLSVGERLSLSFELSEAGGQKLASFVIRASRWIRRSGGLSGPEFRSF